MPMEIPKVTRVPANAIFLFNAVSSLQAKSNSEVNNGTKRRNPINIGTYLNRFKNKIRMMLMTMKNR